MIKTEVIARQMVFPSETRKRTLPLLLKPGEKFIRSKFDWMTSHLRDFSTTDACSINHARDAYIFGYIIFFYDGEALTPAPYQWRSIDLPYHEPGFLELVRNSQNISIIIDRAFFAGSTGSRIMVTGSSTIFQRSVGCGAKIRFRSPILIIRQRWTRSKSKVFERFVRGMARSLGCRIIISFMSEICRSWTLSASILCGK